MKRLLLSAAVAAAVVTIGASVAAAHDDDHHHDSSEHGHGNGRHHHDARSPTVPGAREIDVAATSFEFSPGKITIESGEDVTIALTSHDALHDFVVKGAGHLVAAKAGTTRRGGLMIDEPGRYRFFCSVRGHRAQGMKGTIVVE